MKIEQAAVTMNASHNFSSESEVSFSSQSSFRTIFDSVSHAGATSAGGARQAQLLLMLQDLIARMLESITGKKTAQITDLRQLLATDAIDTTAPDWQAQALAATRGPADGVLEAIGDVALAAPLLKLIKPGGFACAYGAPEDGKAYPPGWTTASVEEHRAYAWVADLLLRGWVRPEWFVTHTWPLSEAVQAFDCVRQGGVIKGIIVLGT